MKRIAVGMLLVCGVALSAPAHAQSFWYGAGPFGVGVAVAPYNYGPTPYWGAPLYAAPAYNNVYAAPVSAYGYAPGWAYPAAEPEASYSYVQNYRYAPGYAYGYSYGPPATYAYLPMRPGPRILLAAPERRVVVYRNNRGISSRALAAQASVPPRTIKHTVKAKKGRY